MGIFATIENMPPSQSDEEWISTLREKAKADFTSFYLLRIVFRGQEHVKIGVASAHNVNDRAWTITDNRGRRFYFNVLLWMPNVVPKYDFDRRSTIMGQTANIEQVMHSILSEETGGPVATIKVDGNVSTETFKTSAAKAMSAVACALSHMQTVGTGWAYGKSWRDRASGSPRFGTDGVRNRVCGARWDFLGPIGFSFWYRWHQKSRLRRPVGPQWHH